MISVIITVYNREKWIERAIESVVNQDYQNMDIIIVDDGSTDGSVEICDKFANQDKRIKVVHKQNQGVAVARQTGIDLAKGDYIIFIDSDDWIEQHYFSEMMQVAKLHNSDIVVADYYYETKESVKRYEVKHNYKSSSEYLKDIIEEKQLAVLWNKLLKRSVIANSKFVPNINYNEDTLFIAQFLENDLKMSFIDKAFYRYCVYDDDSITRNYTEDIFKQRLQFVNTLRKIRPERKYSNSIDILAFKIKVDGLYRGYLNHWNFNRYSKTPLHFVLKQEWTNNDKIRFFIFGLLNNIGIYK